MNINTRSVGDIFVIDLEGAIVEDTAEEFKLLLTSVVNRNERKVVLNFSGVTYITSVGIGTIVQFYKNLKKKEGNVVITGCSQMIKDLMKMTGINEVLDFLPAVTDAVTYFEKTSMSE